MSRFLAILLIPFFALGNVLAQSHGGVSHPSHNEDRVHFHIGGNSHHGHDHHGMHSRSHHDDDDHNSAGLVPQEHDSDAIYVAATDSLFRPSDRGSSKVVSLCVWETKNSFCEFANRPPREHSPPLGCASELPLFLLHAALRL
jgi:hypothetical protein